MRPEPKKIGARNLDSIACFKGREDYLQGVQKLNVNSCRRRAVGPSRVEKSTGSGAVRPASCGSRLRPRGGFVRQAGDSSTHLTYSPTSQNMEPDRGSVLKGHWCKICLDQSPHKVRCEQRKHHVSPLWARVNVFGAGDSREAQGRGRGTGAAGPGRPEATWVVGFHLGRGGEGKER